MKRFLVASGPNLNLLGSREPEIYGTQTLAAIEAEVRATAARLGCEVDTFQTNHEGALLDWLQAGAGVASGAVINPGAFAHYSYALYDCMKALRIPIVEVHISNVHARTEEFRRTSVTAPAARGIISGLGSRGYSLALEYLFDLDQ